MSLFKALCPRCSHIVYIFEKPEFSPEVVSSSGDINGLDVKCPFHGSNCVTAPADEEKETDIVCGCHRCTMVLRMKARKEELERKRAQKMDDEQSDFQNTFAGLV